MTTRTHQLPPAAWGPYFLRTAPHARWSRVTVEVLDRARKRVTAASNVQVAELTLDPGTGDLQLTGPELDHTVAAVRQLTIVEDEAGRLVAIQAVDGAGIRHVIHLRPPRAL